MKDIARANDIPVMFGSEAVKFGTLLRSYTDDCLRIWHPEHAKDYFSIIVHKIKKSGGTFVKGLFTGHQPEDGYGGMFVGAAKMMQGTAGMLFHAVKAIGGSKSKMQEEEAWYDAIYSLICEALG